MCSYMQCLRLILSPRQMKIKTDIFLNYLPGDFLELLLFQNHLASTSSGTIEGSGQSLTKHKSLKPKDEHHKMYKKLLNLFIGSIERIIHTCNNYRGVSESWRGWRFFKVLAIFTLWLRLIDVGRSRTFI